MTMQIKTIALYSKTGEIRSISFRLGAVNIITGKSRTGKSSLIDIVDYCLGRSTFKVFEGVNRETVAWYAVVLQINEGQILLAKPAPAGSARSQSSVYMQEAVEVALPVLADLQVNTNDKAVVAHLSRLLGISENKTNPGANRTMQSFEATLDHTKYYLFQEQGLVANRKLLFYRQDEPIIPQHIKDTMPYFLGAVQEDRVSLVQQLRDARRQAALARRKLDEAISVVSNRLIQAQTLLAEARAVGITSEGEGITEPAALFSALRAAAEWTPATFTLEASDALAEAQNSLREAENAFASKQREIREVESFLRHAQGYRSEAQQQALRLQSIGLVQDDGADNEVCPVCASQLSNPTPAVNAITRSLDQLQGNLHSVTREEPRLQEHLATLRAELEARRLNAQERRAIVSSLVEQRERASRLQETNIRAAVVVGRIGLYLENVNVSDENAVLRRNLADAERRVEELEAQLDVEEMQDLKESILRLISAHMTEWAQRLQLEHAGAPYRLDDKQLTVVADTPERPIVMERMGSGENWLGCHLIALLALHQHFIRRTRPVPNFLFLDQPSQVYFPSEESYKALEGEPGSVEEVGADVLAVQRMFDFLFDTVEALAPNLQIIVTEHANLPDERFQKAMVEPPWRGGRALIPADWLT
ncbi:MAG: DUF3732 domain-containing protein [Roseiflexaceae bacterium]